MYRRVLWSGYRFTTGVKIRTDGRGRTDGRTDGSTRTDADGLTDGRIAADGRARTDERKWPVPLTLGTNLPPKARRILNLVRPNFSLVASPSSCRHPSALDSVRVRPRIREAAVLGWVWRGGRSPPKHFDFVKLFLHGRVGGKKKQGQRQRQRTVPHSPRGMGHVVPRGMGLWCLGVRAYGTQGYGPMVTRRMGLEASWVC